MYYVETHGRVSKFSSNIRFSERETQNLKPETRNAKRKILMNYKYVILSFILLLITVVPSLAQTSLSASKKISADEQARFDYYFFEAQRLKDINQYDSQMEALRMCLEIDSTSGAAQGEIGMLYARMNNLPQATQSLKKAVESDPSNWWYRVQYISMLSAREQFQTAVEQAEQLKNYYPLREDVYTILTSLYKQTGDYDKAIGALNQLEQFTGINEYLTFEKFQLYAILNKEKQAIDEFNKLILKYPKESKYKVLLGDIYLDQKQPKKALELYRSVQKEEPDNPFVYVSLANYYKQQNEPEKAMESIVSALKNPKLPSHTKMEILGQYVDRLLTNEQKIDETEGLFKMLIEMYPFEELPHAYYAVFLQNQNRDDEAIAELENLIGINPKNDAAWKTILQIYTQKEDTTAILDFTERGIRELPQVAEFYFYRSIAQYQRKEYDAALKTNELALVNLGNSASAPVLSSFYGQIGDIYYQQKNKTKAFENYEKALEVNPGNTYIMNNYAYYLSEEKQDLRKAERMSGKTVELEPNNSTYLDTYAWILYQQGNYSLAKLYIDKAISNLQEERESDVIYDHAGDIYAATNDMKKALELWEKAYSINSDNVEIKNKIDKVNLL